MTKIEQEVERLTKEIDDAGSIDKMSQVEWKEFLEEMIGELQSRLTAVREELGE